MRSDVKCLTRAIAGRDRRQVGHRPKSQAFIPVALVLFPGVPRAWARFSDLPRARGRRLFCYVHVMPDVWLCILHSKSHLD